MARAAGTAATPERRPAKTSVTGTATGLATTRAITAFNGHCSGGASGSTRTPGSTRTGSAHSFSGSTTVSCRV